MMKKWYLLCLMTGLLFFGSKTAGELCDIQVVEAREAETVAASEAVTVTDEDLQSQREHMEEAADHLKAQEMELKARIEAGDDTDSLTSELQRVQQKREMLLAELEI